MTSKKKWFKEVVESKPPYDLGGWSKTQRRSTRRLHALSSRPLNWTRDHRYLSAGRALQALANVTQDKITQQRALSDVKFFFTKAKKLKK
jgi:hypothetical protein